MQQAEFDAVRARIPESDEELALDLGVPVERLRRWARGDARIPRLHARRLAYFADLADRDRALEKSGLAECTWMAEFDAAEIPEGTDAILAHLERAKVHATECPTCLARERFVDARFGPVPPFPEHGWMAVFQYVEGLPESVRPAAYGAAALAALSALRGLVAIPAIIAKPSLIVELLFAIAISAVAGAAAGFVYTLVRPPLRALGRPGDYLTGIVCVGAYMLALALTAPSLFGDDLLKDRVGWYSLGATILFFGLVIGHSWFKPDADVSDVRERAD